jgi:periplasmic protein TonB
MLAYPWTVHPELPTRRFAAALVASLLVHASLSAVVTPGSAGRHRIADLPAPLAMTARLVTVEPLPPVVERELPVRPIVSFTAPREVRKPAAPAAPAPHAELAGQAGALDLPDPTYYAARQLDVYPALASAFELRYPAGAAASDVKGRVLLLLLIDAQGVVNEASIVEAEPAGYFEEDALKAFRAARFKPALKNGRAVKSRIVVNVNYGAESGTP